MENRIYLPAHPLWLAGFRPFFALAMLSGLSLPVLWALIYSGVIAAPQTAFSIVQWHAHEMFFGFGWAVLGGFLLTATRNWVGVRGYHGHALMFLAAAWLFERAGMWFGGAWPPLLFRISNNLFIAAIVAMLMWTLISNRKSDSYRDNYFLLLILPVFLLSKNLMLSADYYPVGWSMALGLFRMAFLVMLERTLTQFMKSVFQVAILNDPLLNRAIKLLGLLLVFAGLMPAQLAGWIALLLALLLAGRFIYWKPQLAMRRLDIGIMYLGYLALVAQLLIEFLRQFVHPGWGVSVSIHVFTFGVMGLIIPAMLVRISRGHTGRKVVFDTLDKAALWVMLLGFVLRIIAPRLHPAGYALWIYLAASCWMTCFALLAWRYIPFLFQPRVDGKEH
ncbi:MAG TPA: NnrS family protein [Gallionella sp.]|nr:NnrS family protein [Gallionella sp.]